MFSIFCSYFQLEFAELKRQYWGVGEQHNRPGNSPHCPNCPSSKTPPRPNLDRSALGSNFEEKKSGKMKTVRTTGVGVLLDTLQNSNPTEF